MLSIGWKRVHRQECEKVPRDLYHWSDTETKVFIGVYDYGRYDGIPVPLPLRIMSLHIVSGLKSLIRVGVVHAEGAMSPEAQTYFT
jgi:hypothetical protein